MLDPEKIQKYSYESLVGLIRYGEVASEDIDQICEQLIKRPKCEKNMFDFAFSEEKSSSCIIYQKLDRN